MDSSPPNPDHTSAGKVFLRVLTGNLLLAGILWTLGFGAFLAFTLEMDNDFARHAREHHRMTALLANVRTLPAYGLLAVAYSLVGFPLVLGRWRALPSRPGVRGLLGRLPRLALTNLLLCALSLGIAAIGNPSFLDAACRYLSLLHPDFSLYWMIDWHVPEVLAGLLGLLVLRAIWTYRNLMTGQRTGIGRILAFDGPAVLITSGLVLGMTMGKAPPRTWEDSDRPHVFVIGSDSLRADHLHCYGYERETSPHIDALADEAVLFENLHVSTASTLESWLTILSSRFPKSHGIRYMFPSRERVERAGHIPDILPRILGARGYHTAVSSNWAGNCFSLVDMGFEANRASDIQNFDVFLAEATLLAHAIFPLYFNNRVGEWLYPEVRQITTYLNPDALIDRYVEELDAALTQERPFFGVLFTSHTHLPFAASYPFNQQWVDTSYRGPNRFQIDFEVDDFIQNGFRDREDMSDEQRRHISDLYDGTVTEFDRTVGNLVAMLKKRGLYENSLIIVMTDHGDDLYDPDTTLGHGTNFFGGDQTTRIPVVMKLPHGRLGGTRVHQIARSVDLAPTLLDILKTPPGPGFEGVSLLPACKQPPTALDLPAFAETCYLFYSKQTHGEDVLRAEPADRTLRIDPEFRNNFVLEEKYHQIVLDTKDRMMRTSRWKLLWIPGKRGPIYRFYDIIRDPQQLEDLSGRRLPVMRRMIKHLEAWWQGRTDLRWSPADDEPDRR